MAKRKYLCRILILVTILSCLFFTSVSAEVFSADSDYTDSDPTDYITKQFNVAVTVDKDHIYHVDETIEVEFITAHHGIYRYIPRNERYYDVKNVDIHGDDYDSYWEGSTDSDGYYIGDLVVQIGDSDEEITGSHTYHITYDIAAHPDDTGKDNYFSLNLLPTGWSTSIQSSKITVEMPEEVDSAALNIYGGLYGENQTIPYSIEQDGKTFVIEAVNLPLGYGITAYSDLPDNYWNESSESNAKLLFIICACVLFVGFILYMLFGRKPEIVETVEFYPPDNLTPAEIGYIIDGAVDSKDISSMLMYYASKGYLKIVEYEDGQFRLDKLKDIDSQLEKTHAVKLFNGIFKKKDSRKISKLPNNYYNAVSEAESSIYNEYIQERTIYKKYSRLIRFCTLVLACLVIVAFALLVKQVSYRDLKMYEILVSILPLVLSVGCAYSVHDRFRSSTRKNLIVKSIVSAVFATIGIGLIVIPGLITGIPACAVSLGTVLILLVISVFLRTFSKEHADLVGRVFGFRNFIETAEYDRLKLISDDEPEYYFNILPYAMVMGLETKWSRKFTDIVTANPQWFEPYGNRIYRPVVFCSMMDDCRSSYSESFVNTSSSRSGSGGGGFSGGFSGGGFGGGGGGAW